MNVKDFSARVAGVSAVKDAVSLVPIATIIELALMALSALGCMPKSASAKHQFVKSHPLYCQWRLSRKLASIGSLDRDDSRDLADDVLDAIADLKAEEVVSLGASLGASN